MVHEKTSDSVRELRVEGLGWVVVGVALALLLGGAFLLGRWVERRAAPVAAASSAAPAAGGAATAPELDAGERASYFDRISGGEQAAEPQRQVPSASDTPAAVPASPAADSAAPASSAPTPGEHYVQVFATRDPQTAEGLRRRLAELGHAVRLFTEREGRGELHRVRVGGYATEEQARAAAQQLQKQGFPGAFVTPAD